jgi:hypothetical protein
MPVPNIEASDVRRVVLLVRRYIEAASAGVSDLFHEGFSETEQRDRLIKLDAQVLRLYDLPSRAERRLLDLFAGYERPGIPFSFSRYYPSAFTGTMPLYAYLSDSFQRRLNGGDPSLALAVESRYDELMLRLEPGTLTSDERAELYDLQAEVDGRDYAVQIPDDSWLEEADERQREADAALGSLANHAIDTTLRGASDHED